MQDRGKDFAGNQRAIRRLHNQCERARALFSSTHVTIEIDSLLEGIRHSCSLPRARAEELCMNYFCRFQGPREEFFNGKEPNRSINTDETVDTVRQRRVQS